MRIGLGLATHITLSVPFTKRHRGIKKGFFEIGIISRDIHISWRVIDSYFLLFYAVFSIHFDRDCRTAGGTVMTDGSTAFSKFTYSDILNLNVLRFVR